MRRQAPKIAANSRQKGTATENQAIVTGSFTVKGDQLTYKVPAPSVSAGSGELVWKRVKPQL